MTLIMVTALGRMNGSRTSRCASLETASDSRKLPGPQHGYPVAFFWYHLVLRRLLSRFQGMTPWNRKPILRAISPSVQGTPMCHLPRRKGGLNLSMVKRQTHFEHHLPGAYLFCFQISDVYIVYIQTSVSHILRPRPSFASSRSAQRT